MNKKSPWYRETTVAQDVVIALILRALGDFARTQKAQVDKRPSPWIRPGTQIEFPF